MDWKDDNQVLKALIALYNRQTDDELVTHSTKHLNGMGFNTVDAAFLTDIAELLVINQKPISQAQFFTARSCLYKYSMQLSGIDLDSIPLPSTAYIYKYDKIVSDGLLKIEKGHLQFYPNVFPSDQIRVLNFRGGKDKNGKFYWYGNLNYSNMMGVVRMFPNLIKDSTVDEWEQELLKVDNIEGLNKTSLFEEQKKATSFLVKHKRALLALAPGLGKTVCSILAMQEIGGNTLIVCPLTLTRTWRNEIWKWIKKPSAIWHQTYGSKPYEFVITNYDTLTAYTEEYINLHFDNLIVDESILIKNHHRTKVADDNGKDHWKFTTVRVRCVNEIAQSVDNVFLLSGAPTSRYYDDMWSQLHILDSKRFGSYWKFAERYCVIDKLKWGWKISGNRPNSDRILNEDLADIYFCRTQDQVVDLPDWIFDDVEIDMLPEQAKAYISMEEKFIAELPEGDTILATNVLAQITRLIQLASNPILIDGKSDQSAKWKAAVELLEFEELPAIIWTNFIYTATSITDILLKKGYTVRKLTGSTSSQDRQDTVDAFQHGYLDVIVAHPEVGKFGLTLTAGRTAIYLERSYDGDDYYQSLYRIRRIGTTKSPHVIHLLSTINEKNFRSETIDHVINRVLKFRADSSYKLTTGIIREILQKRLINV